jgi:hypothetical protein
VLVRNAFRNVLFRQMVNLLVVHGTCKNLYIYNGKSGIVKVTADTIACLIERKKTNHLTLARSSIMVNGHSSVFMGCRFVAIEAIHFMLSFDVCFVSTEPMQCCSNFATL